MSIRLIRTLPAQLAELHAELRQNLAPVFASEARSATSGSYSTAHSERPSEPAFRVFEIAAKNWFRPMTEIRGEFGGTSGEEFKNLANSLMTFGYATIHSANTFAPGNKIRFFLPTRLGRERLREARVSFMQIQGDAPRSVDGTHIYYQNRIAQTLALNDWTVQIEQALREKRVDVGATKSGVMHAYEVVNDGIEKEIHNLVADIDEGWQRVTFCVGTEQTKRDLKNLVALRVPLLQKQCGYCLLETFRK